jgi:hypothetical protein
LKKIAIVGAEGLAREVAGLIDDIARQALAEKD